MDLLLFSTDPSVSLQAQLTQGLPLKAVYCDSLVGFRYLYPRPTPPGSSPVNDLLHAQPPLLTRIEPGLSPLPDGLCNHRSCVPIHQARVYRLSLHHN